MRSWQALRADARRRGRPPTTRDWHDRAPGRPTATTVRAVVGSWSQALEQAGLEPRPAGGQRQARCKRGHPLDEANVHRYPDGRRTCRTCKRKREAKRRREAQRARRKQKRRRRRLPLSVRQRQRYRKRKATGLCPKCGRPRDGDNVCCQTCLARLREAWRQRQVPN